MPALLDTLDRFNYTSSSIRSVTRSQVPSTDPGPFTAAILNLTPQDLLRDADESEYGLFTFIRDSSDSPLDTPATQGKIRRKEFRGATPLRPRRAGAEDSREEEPEVYVEAALKYLDRFRAAKSMPHARAQLEALIERLNRVRDNIDRLQSSLEEAAQGGRTSPTSQATEEERRIGELKSRILQLRKRKDALSKLPAKSKIKPRPVTAGTRILFTKVIPPRRSPDSSSVVSTLSSHTKPNSGRHNPHHHDSLLDEEMDMSGFDALMSPTPSTQSLPPKLFDKLESHKRGDSKICDEDLADDHLADQDGEEEDGRDDDEDSEEPTIVLSKLRPPQSVTAPAPAPSPALTPAPVHASITAPPSPPPSRPTSRPALQSSVPEVHTPSRNEITASTPSSTQPKPKKVRITAEVERICSKIWSTIPDLLVPGNNFSSPGKKPPNARDTIAVLQTISAQQILEPTAETTSSPSTRSTLSSLLGIEFLGPAGGSLHQIMTAHLLFSLLTAPNHAMPLTSLKALLTSKATVPSPRPNADRETRQSAAAWEASAAQTGTRALYGCVAKKLVKIDRGGGEQVVKFD